MSFFVLPAPLPPLLLPLSPTFSTLCLALGNPALLAFGNKEALFFGLAQNPIPGHFRSKTFQQAFWGFTLSQVNLGHSELTSFWIVDDRPIDVDTIATG
jgi:hypothetical protein